MGPTLEARPGPAGLSRYEPLESHYDEAFLERGLPRTHYAGLLAGLDGADLCAVGDMLAAELRRRGVSFRTRSGPAPFHVDPLPRIITAPEWEALAAGLAQRARALNAFIADVYSERSIVAAGRVPEAVVEQADHHEPLMRGVPVPGQTYATVAGLDVVRDRDGSFKVLEDNLRTPSGLAYAAATRSALDRCLPSHPPARRHSPDGAFKLLARGLRAAAPDGRGDPSIVLLSDGPANSAWYEHRELAKRLRVPLVTLDDLHVRSGRLWARTAGRSLEVQVVYRRTDEDRLTDERGKPTRVAEALLDPCRTGRLACVNAFGSGVADDKLVHAYVEEMIRFYLDEEPKLRSVPTYGLEDPETRGEVLDRLDQLVVKPRTGHGGHGVVICAQADERERERLAGQIERSPERFIAQETVKLSLHPTVCGDVLAPRHVDLRPFVISAGNELLAAPAALTRVALAGGSMVVNSSQRGGGKDTWVMA